MSKFVWHDLMTTDVEKSKRFYGELFNWRLWEGKGGGPYLHISAGEKDIGGMMALDPKHGAPSHWVGYASTSDVDGVIAKLTAGGGQVHMPAQDMPNVGRFAVVADPQGGVFSPFNPVPGTIPEGSPGAAPKPGEFCWDELLVGDPAAAVKLYETLFGWTHDSMEMPGMGTYFVLKEGATSVAGVMKTPPGAPPRGHWLTYVSVADTDATLERVAKLGGRALSPAMNVPEVGRFAAVMDTAGAPFAVLGPIK